ncbi:Ig-like domain-containing protein, partial [Flavobacterium aquidurense]
MRNFTLSQSKFFRLISLVLLFITSVSSFAQICGTPGADGPVAITGSVNTYYPIAGNRTLPVGSLSIVLGAVPATDQHKNNFGTTPISVGDLILIIQMQDATINSSNDASYGSGTTYSGPDVKGGTGFTDIGNSGIFEYVIATSNVPLAGGNLTFKGTGPNGGAFNSFYNADATGLRGKRTFQVIRVPQYSNLTLKSDITTPPFNGVAGGVIAFNVSGFFDFNRMKIDGNARGFRGGFSPKAASGANNATTYVGLATNTAISCKGEGIAGTPKYMWDGFNQVTNATEGLPVGSSGRGAAANAGGGGNDHNTGGGGGGNGGYGGLGGYGWQGYAGGDRYDNGGLTGGGRPGFKSFPMPTAAATPSLTRLIMGGGGGAGDANDAVDGVKGGVGGAIVLINAGVIQGVGLIEANGGDGAPGIYGSSPDGAGGAGAGGTVLLNISNSSSGTITINAKGGKGGNTERDTNNEHGPGGGGGGGIIRHNLVGTVTTYTDVSKGLSGMTTGATSGTTAHGAMPGSDGHVSTFVTSDLPANLQVNSSCFPRLETTVKSSSNKKVCNSVGEKVSYEIQIKNIGVGNAAGVVLDFDFPNGIEFDSAIATYSVDASGPTGNLTNTATGNNPLFGGFNIAKDGVVTIILTGKIVTSIAADTYSSNAQALYLDPTRTSVNRQITALTYAYNSVNKNYEGASQAPVPGFNFNGTGTADDDIVILALPNAPTASVTTQASCTTPTGTIKVSSPANGTNIKYTLTGTNPVTAPINNSTGTFSGLVAGKYKVTTTDPQGCTSLPSNEMTVDAILGAPTTIGVSICQGDSGGVLTATSSSCSSNDINWFADAVGGLALFKGASFTPTLTDRTTVRTIIYYASCPLSTCRAAANFVIKPKPTITNTVPASRCDAGTLTLGATASSGTINWYTAATGGTFLTTGTTYATPSLSTTTSYYVDATDNGCTTGTRTEVKATINTTPTINSTTEGSNCGPGAVALLATASSGATIDWYTTLTGGSSLYTGGSFTPTLSTTTTYYVGATIVSTGCTSTSRIAVTAVINNPSTITLTSGTQNPAVCAGAAIPMTVYTFGGSATNAIVTNLPIGLDFKVDPDAKTVTISGTPTTNGTYSITTVGHTAPCSAVTIMGKVTVNSLPATPTISPSSTAPICFGGNIVLTSSTASGYQWYKDGVAISGATGNTYSAVASGTYTVVTSNANCSSLVSQGRTVTVNPKPTVSITGNLTACLTTTLSAVSDASSSTYVWYKDNLVIAGQTSSSLVVNADGDYKVKVKNTSTGCEQTSSVSTVKVSDTQKPVKPVLADATGECSVTVTAPTTTDSCKGTITGTTSDPLAYSTQGTYTITWSFDDGNGNTETATQKVIVKDTQKPTKPVLADATGECSVTVTAPTTTDSCKGTITGTTSDPLAYSTQGTYTITWSFDDGNGNTETATQKVIVKDTQKPTKPVLADATGECSVTVTAPTTTDSCKGTITGTTSDPLAYSTQG